MMKNKAKGTTLIDNYLPQYEFVGIHSKTVHASPTRIFQAVREGILDDIPIAKFLGELRYLPSRLTGKMKSKQKKSQPFLETVLESGNIILAEEKDQELVIGVIGKLHQISDQEFVELEDAQAFIEFSHPDYQKLAQSFRISGGDENTGYRITFEHRTHALSAKARRKFSRYWILIKPSSALLMRLLLRAIKRRAEA